MNKKIATSESSKSITQTAQQLITYALIGCLNTLIHWVIFILLHYGFGSSQAISNLLAFAVAVTCSFLLNAKVTFQAKASLPRFISFTGFMAFISWLVGTIADNQQLHPIITLVAFSIISLILGFLYSKFIVFRHTS